MPGAIPGPRTLYDKVVEDHIVDEKKDGTILLYIGTLDEQNLIAQHY
jgi:3-isopropylmalate dehydratase